MWVVAERCCNHAHGRSPSVSCAKNSVSINLTYLLHLPGTLLIHKDPLHDVEVSVWCAMNANRIIGPIFHAETIILTGMRHQRYGTSFSAPLFLLFCAATLDSYWEDLLAHGGESCSFCRQVASDSWTQLYALQAAATWNTGNEIRK
jgi:hypothetical protein